MPRRVSILIAAGLLVAACAKKPTTDSTAEPAPQSTPVHVRVSNNYIMTVTVYAVTNSTRYRMGSVNPGLSTSFLLQQAMVGSSPVQFLVDPGNGDQPFESDRFIVSPGAIVDIHIEQHLLSSSATVH